MRTMLAALCALLVVAGCGGTDAASPAASRAPESPPASTEGSSDTSECTSPAGFRVSHPADWSVNPGRVLPVCSWFAAESFAVPGATDARIADITLKVVEGNRPTSTWPDVTASTAVEVGGRPGVRLERAAGPGLYPAGTLITTYVVDLPADPSAGASTGTTLVASTVSLPRFDYPRNVEVLDAMMASLVVDAASGA
jgi:hypothetical protein